MLRQTSLNCFLPHSPTKSSLPLITFRLYRSVGNADNEMVVCDTGRRCSTILEICTIPINYYKFSNGNNPAWHVFTYTIEIEWRYIKDDYVSRFSVVLDYMPTTEPPIGMIRVWLIEINYLSRVSCTTVISISVHDGKQSHTTPFFPTDHRAMTTDNSS